MHIDTLNASIHTLYQLLIEYSFIAHYKAIVGNVKLFYHFTLDPLLIINLQLPIILFILFFINSHFKLVPPLFWLVLVVVF